MAENTDRDYFSAQSSFIESCGYDPQTQTLGVKFKNGESWNYKDVEPDVWASFKKATSTGSYFHQNIKDIYSGIRVQ